MNTENLNQEVLNEELEQVEFDNTNSEDYQNVLNAEQEAFENGIDDEDVDLDMDEEHINEQTKKFLELRVKKQV